MVPPCGCGVESLTRISLRFGWWELSEPSFHAGMGLCADEKGVHPLEWWDTARGCGLRRLGGGVVG